MILRSRKVVTPDGVRPACIHVEGERILDLLPYDPVLATVDLIDAGDSYILPGLVDTHVHFNEPGRTDWEGYETGTLAAAAGGITTIVEMPLNSVPGVTSVDALDQKRNAVAGKCTVDYGFWGGLVADNHADIQPLADAGVLGFKCFLVDPGVDSFTEVTPHQLEMAMPAIARTNLPLLAHAELPGPIEEATSSLGPSPDWRSYQTYLLSRPDASEVAAIRLLIDLSRRYKCRVHVVHLASIEALPDLQLARLQRVTIETCPHYLHFVSERIEAGATNWKCAPPIRSAANRERLWQALLQGEIDLVASDHSPCPPALKQRGNGDFSQAWGGIASLQLGLSIMWTEMHQRGIGIENLARWMAQQPALLAGLDSRKGRIAPGFDADIVVFNPDLEFTVRGADLFHRHPITPYEGERLRGVVMQTYLRGRLIYDAHESFHGLDRYCGRELRRPGPRSE